MNKITKLTAAVICSLSLGMAFTSCQSTTPQEKNANDKVDQAKKDLEAAQSNAKKVASAEEWNTFRQETELKIKENKLRIEELKLKKKRSGDNMDAVYDSRISMLEKQNDNLRERMENYEKNQSDWESFKREFNRDIDELGKSLKDFSVDNK